MVITQHVTVELWSQHVVDAGHNHGEVRGQGQRRPQLRPANLARPLPAHREVGVEQARMHHVQVASEPISPPDVDPVGAGVLNALNSAVTDRNQAKGHTHTPHDRDRGRNPPDLFPEITCRTHGLAGLWGAQVTRPHAPINCRTRDLAARTQADSLVTRPEARLCCR
jgi:hypothetical protein